MANPAVMVFGLGFLQKSLIEQCRALGYQTIGVDIIADAACKGDVDFFEIAAGDDYESTLEIAKKYKVSGLVTAATDKPLVMMARVAEEMKLPFYSVQTATWSTDKQLMKQRFQQYGVPCAKGVEIRDADELDTVPWNYPVIVKPRDNSGSRGVIFCENRKAAATAIEEARSYSHKDSILVEEFIDGQEYSIESMHYQGKTHVIQFTQKITTDFPYNVELGHIQPANLNEEQKETIRSIVERIAEALGFDNCASHTELKVNRNGITVIETSPRLGGDFITSMLTPLSTGVNLENLLIRMSVGDEIRDDEFQPKLNLSSGVVFFELPQGKIVRIGNLASLLNVPGCQCYEFEKNAGDTIGKITNSIDRYGYAVVQTDNREITRESMKNATSMISRIVRIDLCEK